MLSKQTNVIMDPEIVIQMHLQNNASLVLKICFLILP